MAESEIISALNSLRACLESQLLITNQIVKEFMSSFDSHFVSLQHNKLHPNFVTNENIEDVVTNTKVAAEIVGNINVETKVAEHVETEVDNKLDVHIVDDFKLQLDVVEVLEPIETYIVGDSSLPMELLVGVICDANDKIVGKLDFLQLVTTVLNGRVGWILRCIKHEFKFLAIVRGRTLLARRMVVFKLYALELVYVESLNLYLEDKVVLKG